MSDGRPTSATPLLISLGIIIVAGLAQIAEAKNPIHLVSSVSGFFDPKTSDQHPKAHRTAPLMQSP